MDEDDAVDEDDKSVTSTATTISTGSVRLYSDMFHDNTWSRGMFSCFQVGSNTPSVVGESLENFSLEGVSQQGEPVKKAWVSASSTPG